MVPCTVCGTGFPAATSNGFVRSSDVVTLLYLTVGLLLFWNCVIIHIENLLSFIYPCHITWSELTQSIPFLVHDTFTVLLQAIVLTLLSFLLAPIRICTKTLQSKNPSTKLCLSSMANSQRKSVKPFRLVNGQKNSCPLLRFMSSLAVLPEEILVHHIFVHLPPTSLIALEFTCKWLHTIMYGP